MFNLRKSILSRLLTLMAKFIRWWFQLCSELVTPLDGAKMLHMGTLITERMNISHFLKLCCFIQLVH